MVSMLKGTHNAKIKLYDDNTNRRWSLSFDQKSLHLFDSEHVHETAKNVDASSTLLSFVPICYTSNMSGKHVLQGTQNVVISGSTFNTADTVCEAP